MAVNVVETEGLSKRYGSLEALRDMNLTIEEGSIYGFIGPNGAGKTTTLKILATLLSPSSGIAKICGVSVMRNPEDVRSLIGYMPDFFGVYDDMKVWEYMDFFGAAFKLPKAKRAAMI
ncbi:MAG: ATP-binding cassette domain-containing protein [Actinobacteria bacterium]|nr:ATP-binding cassette domain-containing protein [Actinomycetota bacterium]